MADKAQATGEYDGVEFYVDEYWKFCVPSLEKRYDDYKTMCERIDASKKAIAASQRRKMSLSFLTGDLVPVTVTALHAGNGGWISTPKIDGDQTLYIDCATVRTAFEKQAEAEDIVGRMEQILERYAVRPMSNYSREMRFKDLGYERSVKAIEREHAEATKRYETLTFDDELRKTKKPQKIRF